VEESQASDDFDCSKEFKSEYSDEPPLTHVKVKDGSGFKTVVGDTPMTPGGRYFFQVQIHKGILIKIGVTKAGFFSE
jgi:hypothetical protein